MRDIGRCRQLGGPHSQHDSTCKVVIHASDSHRRGWEDLDTEAAMREIEELVVVVDLCGASSMHAHVVSFKMQAPLPDDFTVPVSHMCLSFQVEQVSPPPHSP